MVTIKENRIKLNPERYQYWRSVGALPSERVTTLYNKYMKKQETAAAEAPAPSA